MRLYCGCGLGLASDNYRGACVARRRPVGDVFANLGMRVRTHESGPVVELSEYFCPDCGSCVRADIGLEGAEPPPAPELDLEASS